MFPDYMDLKLFRTEVEHLRSYAKTDDEFVEILEKYLTIRRRNLPLFPSNN